MNLKNQKTKIMIINLIKKMIMIIKSMIAHTNPNTEIN